MAYTRTVFDFDDAVTRFWVLQIKLKKNVCALRDLAHSFEFEYCRCCEVVTFDFDGQRKQNFQRTLQSKSIPKDPLHQYIIEKRSQISSMISATVIN